jgi:hypothetical protein
MGGEGVGYATTFFGGVAAELSEIKEIAVLGNRFSGLATASR